MFNVDSDDTKSRHSTEEERQVYDRLARRNEVVHFQDNRSCGSSGSCWRIVGFDLAEISPPVMFLNIHLENDRRV